MKLLNFKKNESKSQVRRRPANKSVNFLNYYNKQKIVKRSKAPAKLKHIHKGFSKVYNIALIPLLFIAGISLIYFFIFKTNTFKIISINSEGTTAYVSTKDFNELVQNKTYGQNLLFLDTAQLQKTLKDTFLGAKDIQIIKKLPNKLNIVVIERTPMALVYKESDKTTFIIDSDGYVLGFADDKNTDLPKIQYNGDVRVGSFMDKNLVPIYFELVSSLEASNIKASTMSFHEGYVQLYLDNSTQVLMSNSKDAKNSVDIFANLYKQLLVEGKKVNKIDLRYDKVIVSYSQ